MSYGRGKYPIFSRVNMANYIKNNSILIYINSILILISFYLLYKLIIFKH